MLRQIEEAHTISEGSPITALKGCPDCKGKGMLLRNPFALYNKELVHCPTCKAASDYFDKNGEIPKDIADAMTHNNTLTSGALTAPEKE